MNIIDKIIFTLVKWRIKCYIKKLSKKGVSMEYKWDIQGFKLSIKAAITPDMNKVRTVKHLDKDSSIISTTIEETKTMGTTPEGEFSLDLEVTSSVGSDTVSADELTVICNSMDKQTDKIVDGFLTPFVNSILTTGLNIAEAKIKADMEAKTITPTPEGGGSI